MIRKQLSIANLRTLGLLIQKKQARVLCTHTHTYTRTRCSLRSPRLVLTSPPLKVQIKLLQKYITVTRKKN